MQVDAFHASARSATIGPQGRRPSSDGIRATTALRTVIDIAPDLDAAHLRRIVDDCLARGLFTVEEGLARVAREDIADRLGARLVAIELRRRG